MKIKQKEGIVRAFFLCCAKKHLKTVKFDADEAIQGLHYIQKMVELLYL